MNELHDTIQRRLRGMAVRILARIENVVDSDLDTTPDNLKFTILGSDLKAIRSEILNAAGDTTRSLGSIFDQPVTGKHVFSRDTILCLNSAEFDLLDFEDESVPVFKMSGDFAMLRKIRDDIKAGIVYNNQYICAGLEDIVDCVIPYLDIVLLAGIRLGNDSYKGWRNQVCNLYLEGLN